MAGRKSIAKAWRPMLGAFPLALVAASLWMMLPARLVEAASFDCQKARTHVEIDICGDIDLSARDEAMAHLYAISQRGQHASAWLDSQRSWLRERNLCISIDCLRLRYEERLATLRKIDPTFIYGVFEAPNGELHMIQVAPDRIAFRLFAFWERPQGSHIGQLSGEFWQGGGRAEFSDPDGDCGIHLGREENNWLLLQEGGCNAHFGMGVDATGTYRPTFGMPQLASL